MSEEKMSLIEELQNPPYPEGGHLDDLIQSAAARIEQLEAALRWIADCEPEYVYSGTLNMQVVRILETARAALDQSSPPPPSTMTEREEKLEEALQRIASWADAYPPDIFPEPDWKKVRELLEASGITLDAVSGSCMRHVVAGVGKIARAALASDYSARSAPGCAPDPDTR